MKNLVIYSVAALLIQISHCYTPRECYKKDDCGPNECCVLGMERYSIPECKPRGKIDDWCRTGAEPEDRLLYYPNEDIRHVENVYTLFCPCDGGLTCKQNKCTKKGSFIEAISRAGSAGSFANEGTLETRR